MSKIPNRFYRGRCSNEGNSSSGILNYLIYTIRDLSDYEGGVIPEEVKTSEEYFNFDEEGIDDPYYAVYATFKTDLPNGKKRLKIFETSDLKTAIFIVEQITGNKVQEIDEEL